MHKLTDALDEI